MNSLHRVITKVLEIFSVKNSVNMPKCSLDEFFLLIQGSEQILKTFQEYTDYGDEVRRFGNDGLEVRGADIANII